MEKQKLTRKEKKEINKKLWQNATSEARSLVKSERKEIITSLRADDELTWQEKFLEAIKLGLNMAECANACAKGLGDIYDEFDENEDFNKRYARAREIANDLKAEFLETINEEPPREGFDAQGNKFYDKTELQWRKAKEDTTKWILAIRDPKKFGNNSKVDTTVSGVMTTKIIRDDI
jgi:hypothetical protein